MLGLLDRASRSDWSAQVVALSFGRATMPLRGISSIALAIGNMVRDDPVLERSGSQIDGSGGRSYGFQLPNGDLGIFFKCLGVKPVPKKHHYSRRT